MKSKLWQRSHGGGGVAINQGLWGWGGQSNAPQWECDVGAPSKKKQKKKTQPVIDFAAVAALDPFTL